MSSKKYLPARKVIGSFEKRAPTEEQSPAPPALSSEHSLPLRSWIDKRLKSKTRASVPLSLKGFLRVDQFPLSLSFIMLSVKDARDGGRKRGHCWYNGLTTNEFANLSLHFLLLTHR